MPREAMFYAYTRNSARAMNLLDSIGTIAPGKRADLILIDRDVLTVSPEEMRDAKVLWTIVAGKTVYRLRTEFSQNLNKSLARSIGSWRCLFAPANI
jgi:predicted amidohydrolase YtcJ